MLNEADNGNTIFLIPVENMPAFEKRIADLSKRSKKIMGWVIEPLIIGNAENARGQLCMEVIIDYPTIRYEGWEFVASLEHPKDGAAIVYRSPTSEFEVPEHYRSAANHCDHCGTIRYRNHTYVVRHADGQHKQIGSTCLRDFLGHDANRIGTLSETLWEITSKATGEIGDDEDVWTGEFRETNRYTIPVDLFLGYVAASIRLDGRFITTKEAKESGFEVTPTRNEALDAMYSRRATGRAPNADDMARAEAAIAWGKDITETRSEYMHNLKTVISLDAITYRSAGILASAFSAMEREEQRAKPARGAISLDFAPINALFNAAKSKLKRPKINVSTPEGNPLVLSVAGPAARFPNTINVTSDGGYGNSEFYGRIMQDGTFAPYRNAPTELEQFLKAFSANPAKVASAHGHKSGKCCFCNKGLTDARSVDVGYGKTCAENWQLQWG